MGSEMCIRDRHRFVEVREGVDFFAGAEMDTVNLVNDVAQQVAACLLYTSDAADERSSVDLGGRRIIKKKIIADGV